MSEKYLKIIIAMVVCLTIGFSSSYFTMDGLKEWYPTINKPSFNPPNWIFAPVWTTLYILMGISAGIVWYKIKINEIAKNFLIVFIIQLALNFLWSYFFFSMHNPLIAFIDILLLLACIVYLVYSAKKINQIAFYLLIPYLLWVSFATILNATIVSTT